MTCGVARWRTLFAFDKLAPVNTSAAKRILIRAAAIVAVLGALFLAFAYWYDSVGQRPDPAFDASVAHPAFAAGAGPEVFFDVGHRNWHSPRGRYRPLADLLRHDGFQIREIDKALTPSSLEPIRILVIANAMGPDGHEGNAAFTGEEIHAIVDWVRQGGCLLIVADHVPFGSAAESLAAGFGVTMYLAFARDDEQHDGWDNERLAFSRDNGLLADSAITNGRNTGERVERVVTFTGQSLSVPQGAIPLLRMGDASYDWKSRSERTPARGHAQGIAMTFGKGRVLILGEAGMLSAQVDPLGIAMGMNKPGNDDKQFALNVFRWLSGVL